MWNALTDWLGSNFVNVLVGGIISSTLGPLLFQPVRRFVAKALQNSLKFLWAIVRGLPAFMRLRRFVFSEKPLWTYRSAGNVPYHRAPTCLTIMNYKGGVGKTTLAANLAAAFCQHHSMRVLLIDLDYQGSLSDLLRGRDDNSLNLLSDLLSTKKPPNSLEEFTTDVPSIPGAKIITSEYELTNVEENQLQRWLLGDAPGDVRSRLARIISSKKLKLKNEFDLIIFDAPPRMSLASVNALRASDHILVPTKLQPLSSTPIAKMVRELNEFRGKIRGHFNLLGVVCNMTRDAQPSGNESTYYSQIESALDIAPGDPEIFATLIPDRAFVGRPDGANIGYNLTGPKGQEARMLFNRLADEIAGKMGMVEPLALAAE